MTAFSANSHRASDARSALPGSGQPDDVLALPPQEALARLTDRRPTWLLEHYGLDPAA